MNRTRKLTLAGVLVSVMLVLGYLESLLPVSGVPGIKLGLSNCVLLLSLYWLGTGVSFEMMVVKNVLLGLLLANPMCPISLLKLKTRKQSIHRGAAVLDSGRRE